MASSAFWNCVLVLAGCMSVINACTTTNVLFNVYITPANLTVPSFDNVTLTCTDTSVVIRTSSKITYTWHRVDGVIPVKATLEGDHSEILVIPSIVTEDEGEYYCAAEMYGHCAESNKVTVMVDGCPCDPNGSHVSKCDQTAWQCECYPNITGRICDTCAQEGYHGPTKDHDCKRCTCVVENTKECNSRSGECKCKVGWTGDDCSVEEKCPEGATGYQCYTCVDGYYGDPKNNKPCQKCNCNDNVDLTDGASCDNVNGRCFKCLNNTTGQNCHICVYGYYGDAVHGSCRPCGCRGKGAIGKKCDRNTGQCICKKRVTGRTCDQCKDGSWDFGRDGCKPCKCNKDWSTDRVCNKKNGRCRCLVGYTGKRCTQKEELTAFRYNGSAYSLYSSDIAMVNAKLENENGIGSAYSSNIAMETSAQLTLNARLENENGILYYFSQYENGTGNFILVQFLNSIIELSFSEGESVTTISGTQKLPIDKWIAVEIGIEQSEVSILVYEDTDITKGFVENIRRSIFSSPVPFMTTFYVGGIPPPPFVIPVQNSNFIGCLQKTVILLSSGSDSGVAEPAADVNTSLCY